MKLTCVLAQRFLRVSDWERELKSVKIKGHENTDNSMEEWMEVVIINLVTDRN